MSKNKRVEVANQAIGLGALAQLSRNKNINSMGGVFGFLGIVVLVGEMFKFIFKWIMIKPCVFIFKGFWLCFKYITPIVIAFCLAVIQFSYKGIKNLMDNYGKDKDKTI